MSAFEKIASAPVISLAVGVTGSLFAITDLTSSLGIPAFWADCVYFLFFFSLSAFWAISAKRTWRPIAQPGFVSSTSPRGTRFAGLRRAAPSILLASVFLLFATWAVYLPLTHLFASQWQICGTIVTSCGNSYRLQIFDSRGRKINRGRIGPADDTGWMHLKPEAWWAYEPRRMSIQCGQILENDYAVPDDFFDNKCGALMEL